VEKIVFAHFIANKELGIFSGDSLESQPKFPKAPIYILQEIVVLSIKTSGQPPPKAAALLGNPL
jgi:hypothetical protein